MTNANLSVFRGIGKLESSLLGVGKLESSLLGIGKLESSLLGIGTFKSSLLGVGTFKSSLLGVGTFKSSLLGVGTFKSSLLGIGKLEAGLSRLIDRLVGDVPPENVQVVAVEELVGRVLRHRPRVVSRAARLRGWPSRVIAAGRSSGHVPRRSACPGR